MSLEVNPYIVAARLENVALEDILKARVQDDGRLVVVVHPGPKHVYTAEQVNAALKRGETLVLDQPGGNLDGETNTIGEPSDADVVTVQEYRNRRGQFAPADQQDADGKVEIIAHRKRGGVKGGRE